MHLSGPRMPWRYFDFWQLEGWVTALFLCICRISKSSGLLQDNRKISKDFLFTQESSFRLCRWFTSRSKPPAFRFDTSGWITVELNFIRVTIFTLATLNPGLCSTYSLVQTTQLCKMPSLIILVSMMSWFPWRQRPLSNRVLLCVMLSRPSSDTNQGGFLFVYWILERSGCWMHWQQFQNLINLLRHYS